MSTKPGVSQAPSALTRSRAASVTRPTATMRPSRTPTSAVKGALPVPSTTVADSNSQSSILPSPIERAAHAADDVPDAPEAGHHHHAEVAAELHRDDAKRQAGVLHAALDHHGAP